MLDWGLGNGQEGFKSTEPGSLRRAVAPKTQERSDQHIKACCKRQQAAQWGESSAEKQSCYNLATLIKTDFYFFSESGPHITSRQRRYRHDSGSEQCFKRLNYLMVLKWRLG